ncbi:MAG: HlyC/CorC family transporter [Ignavibacteriae bacterium]|nr:MAG: HlyC/CorC family transporter [Ignavibacteriota bacterium]
MIEQFILLVVLLLLSGFFAGTELAFIVANKLKIEVKARNKELTAKNAQYFINHPETFFSTILIGNNIVNVALASLSAVFLASLFGLSDLSILIVSTFFILMFGEIIPKYFSRELSDRVVLLSAIPLRAAYFLLYPFVKISSLLSKKLTQTSSISADSMSQLFDREDVKVLVKESEKAGVVDKKESDIIGKVIELGEQRVYEAMTPRTDIVGLELSDNIDDAISTFIDFGFSKLPVYKDNLDNIKGIILVKDIFKSPVDIKSILREVCFIPETKKSFEVLNEFLEKKISISVVVDEHGGTAGIVTMEDILEEVFGEIKDEFDVEEEICRKIADNSYLVSGKVEADLLNEKYELNIPDGDYVTIGGYIVSVLGRIPAQGEKVKIDNFEFLIARASAQKVEVVKLTHLPE